MGVKFSVAVVIKSDLKSGGGFQYEHMVLNIIKKYHTINSSINIKFFTLNSKVLQDYQDLGLDISLINESIELIFGAKTGFVVDSDKYFLSS